ncbi:MAG TPA: hypothetical protein ENN34_11385 [Deltaproteobacteria bacterium]|nr:hypothetical protein [Deltaproteobacteria bacterium]
MSVTERIDPITSAETLLNEIFQRVFQNDGVRTYLGFSQISQISSDEGLPGWYLWFPEMNGAFSIESTGESVPSPGRDFGNGANRGAVREVNLVIRYFPHPDENIFETFSCYEQLFRMGPEFDETGTPTFEGGRGMHESLYVVGHMTISFNYRTNEIDFSCRAPERWKDYRTDGLTLIDSTGAEIQALSPGECDRDVEGWNLSRHVFDTLVSAYGFLIHRPPSLVGASSRASVHYLIDRNGSVEEVQDTQLEEFSLLVIFSEITDPSDAEKRLTSAGEDLIGLWSDPRTIPEPWQNKIWYEIHDQHFHHGDRYVCSCFHDH